jgi:hypothetical protein
MARSIALTLPSAIPRLTSTWMLGGASPVGREVGIEHALPVIEADLDRKPQSRRS